MNRFFALSISIFIILSFSALGRIEIYADRETYNLGNNMKISASFAAEEDFMGKLILYWACGGDRLKLYETSVNAEKGFRSSYTPNAAASKDMIGECAIEGDLVNEAGETAESSSSKAIIITDSLDVKPTEEDIPALPGHISMVKGTVAEKSGISPKDAVIKIKFNNREYQKNANGGNFSFEVQIPPDIPSGRQEVSIEAADDAGNRGESEATIDIEAVPSSIRIIADKTAVPGKSTIFTIELLDQAAELLNKEVAAELTDAKGAKIFRKSFESNRQIEYEFSQYSKPGAYILRAQFDNLETYFSINITAARKIEVRYKNGYAYVENTGNAEYDNEVEFLLEGNSSNKKLRKNIKLGPGESTKVYLIRSLPEGVYDIKFIEKYGNRGIFEAAEKMIAEAERISHSSAFEKISPRSIVSYVIGSDGIVTKHPAAAPSLLAIIILAIIIRYSGKSAIRRIFRRR